MDTKTLTPVNQTLNDNSGSYPIEVVEPTEEDIASQFPSLVQKALFQESNGTKRYWINVSGKYYRWVKTHYEHVLFADLKRQIVKIAQVTTAERKAGDQSVEYHPFTRPRCIEEALRWFEQITARDASELNPPGLVNCRNGVLCITWEGTNLRVDIEVHNPEKHFFIDPPGLYYDPQAPTEHANRLLECIPEHSRNLFLQVVSAALDIRTIRDRLGHRVPALMAIGQGENGKDTLRQAISLIHGKSSITSIGINDWQQYEAGSGRGRFSIAGLDRARFSIASENSGAFKVDNLQTLKAAITGDPIYVERKGVNGADVIPLAVFVFFLNKPPLLDGGSAAILSRWVVVNMPHSYSTTPRPGQLKADPRFKNDAQWMAINVLPAFLNLMLKSLETVAANGFDIAACADDLQQLREDTSHLHKFLRDYGYFPAGPADHVELRKIWDDLQLWYCQEEWTRYNRSGVLEHINTGDGDKPVLASRLLFKRLECLHPSIRSSRERGKGRITLIYGLANVGSISA